MVGDVRVVGGAAAVRVKKVGSASVQAEARRRVLWRKGTKEVYVCESTAKIPGKTVCVKYKHPLN